MEQINYLDPSKGPITKVFIDLDGVMADWLHFVLSQPECERFQFDGEMLSKHPTRVDVVTQIYANHPDIFDKLPYMNQFTPVLDVILSSDADVAWATSCGPFGDYETNKKYKTQWLARVMKELYGVDRADIGPIHFFKHGQCKSELAGPGCLLIDDYVKNITPFVAAGGQAIKVPERQKTGYLEGWYETSDILPHVEKALGVY